MSALHRTLSEKSDRELLFYINHVEKHTEDAIWTALEILKNRNVELPNDIRDKIEAKLSEMKTKNEELSKTFWTKNVVSDLNAPALYSQKSIYLFSILFSVLFGAGMLAHNLYKVKKPFTWAIMFGLGYTVLAIFLLDKYDGTTHATFLINGLGSVVLYQFFWNKWIGKETKYRTKAVWIPLIIGVVISALWLVLLFG